MFFFRFYSEKTSMSRVSVHFCGVCERPLESVCATVYMWLFLLYLWLFLSVVSVAVHALGGNMLSQVDLEESGWS